ncbi:hypothetical protein [Streptomyces sp. WMMC940]|uniref:hypothetical protein n=1 Tax=Streptomyces sp. WMMC940 TaxID=3015153 RepID=UPI0022B66465|nr:hypothetical protein [Streptomyces sp. WMMC940]MCZ7456171.1 hypothetical protein [Streptomyces sp. WMMC940]
MSIPAPLIGLSSGSAPALGAAELAALTLRLGGTVVDVRAGKGHAWEDTGGLDAMRAAGADVCFVGVSTVLGDAAHPPADCAALPWLEQGLPVKVFAADGCTAPGRIDLTLAQIGALAERTGDPGLVLVETHQGYAPVGELAELCRQAGTAVLLDTLGLARIAPDPLSAAGLLAPWTTHAQVKGFTRGEASTSRHLPLAAPSAMPTRPLLSAVGALRTVTVESRAPSLPEDTALLRQWFAPDREPAETGLTADPVPEEEISHETRRHQ